MLTPGEQIECLLGFLDESVSMGSLVGSGSGRSGEHRLGTLQNSIEAAQELLDAGRTGGVCAQLSTVFERTEGGFPPPDFVEGEAAPEVAARVQTLLSDLGCER